MMQNNKTSTTGPLIVNGPMAETFSKIHLG
jgi:hypothetical protein